MGCPNAIFTLQQVTNYFEQRGSTVCMSSLDASKAFDRVDHAKLFDKLLARSVPICFLRVLVDWYSILQSVVRLNDVFSLSYIVVCGVRQGVVLSPFLFNIYVDQLISDLSSMNVGCYVNKEYFGCIMYADDLILLSPSILGLQDMLDVCCEFGADNDIIFNSRKSVCLKVGRDWSKCIHNMRMGSLALEWSQILNIWVLCSRLAHA